MQQAKKFNKNNSSIIKLTEAAKNRARRRLIGSIVLLFVALIFLLNVTAKIKPIEITPAIVTLKKQGNAELAESVTTSIKRLNTASAITASKSSTITSTTFTAHATNASTSTSHLLTTALIAHETAKIAPSSKSTTTQFASTITPKQNHSDLSVDNNSTSQQHLHLKAIAPTIIEEKAQLSPEDILAGRANTPHRYFIQLIATSNYAKVMQINQKLHQKKINATLSSSKLANNSVIYHLRLGPFNGHDSALKKLSHLKMILE